MSVCTSWVKVRVILSVWREDGGHDGMRPEHLLSAAAWARQFPALAGFLWQSGASIMKLVHRLPVAFIRALILPLSLLIHCYTFTQ